MLTTNQCLILLLEAEDKIEAVQREMEVLLWVEIERRLAKLVTASQRIRRAIEKEAA